MNRYRGDGVLAIDGHRVHGDRRRTRASMTDPDDSRVAVGFDLLPRFGIVPGVDTRQSDKLGPHARQVLAEPVLHLGQEDVGVVEPTVDQVDLLALEGVEPRSHVLGRHARRVARWIQHGYSGAVFRLRANACISLDHGDTSSRLWP